MYFEKYYDLIGIGFGPSNLALAIALEEDKYSGNYLFLDQKATFTWHEGMLLNDARMQTPFLKDLITLHNPNSKFSFLNYLHQQNRLSEFVNLRNFFPSRIEFNHYYQWAAEQVKSSVQYGAKVESIIPTYSKHGIIENICISVKDIKHGHSYKIFAKNLVFGMGLNPHIPANCSLDSERIFHSEYLQDALINKFPDLNHAYRFIVVGSGQSAAEITYNLLSKYEKSKITAISKNFLYRSIDDNHFVNMLYTDKASEDFYHLPTAAKNKLMMSLGGSNYSVADSELIEKIAYHIYEERVCGINRLEKHSFTEVVEVLDRSSNIEVIAKNHLSGVAEKYTADAICLATGYNASHIHSMLNSLKSYLFVDQNGEFSLEEDYKVQSHSHFKPSLYIQGYSEKSHGFSGASLTNLAGRAQVILSSLKNKIIEETSFVPRNSIHLEERHYE